MDNATSYVKKNQGLGYIKTFIVQANEAIRARAVHVEVDIYNNGEQRLNIKTSCFDDHHTELSIGGSSGFYDLFNALKKLEPELVKEKILPVIRLEDIEHGWLYRLNSRNLIIGVADRNTNGFVGIREKFGEKYLFTEYHWDRGEPFGTAKPFYKIKQCPLSDLRESDGNTALFDWLKQEENELNKV